MNRANGEDSGPAFPWVKPHHSSASPAESFPGMTLRDYFAAHLPLRIVGDQDYFEDRTDKEWCELLGIGYPSSGYDGLQLLAFRTELEMRIRLYRADAMLTAKDCTT